LVYTHTNEEGKSVFVYNAKNTWEEVLHVCLH
jgi:hypothetical protein